MIYFTIAPEGDKYHPVTLHVLPETSYKIVEWKVGRSAGHVMATGLSYPAALAKTRELEQSVARPDAGS